MNTRRRGKLHKAIELLDRVEDVIDTVRDEEEDCMGNIPESLQSSIRYEHMEMVCESLEKALECCRDVRACLEEAIS